MTLAILICTLPDRYVKLQRLMNVLQPQIDRFSDRVFTKKHDAGTSMPTGTKRNWLVINSTPSDYFCFVDDDDMISHDYVEKILNAIDQRPDVVTFNGWYTEFGNNRRNFTIKLGSKYYDDPKDPEFYYHRFPNHLAVVKRELVEGVKFPDKWQREDFEWAEQIERRRLLKTSVHIDDMLYHYDCYPKPTRRR